MKKSVRIIALILAGLFVASAAYAVCAMLLG